MQRIRTVKPDFFKHDDLFQAEVDFCLPLRIAYAGLWTCCDREGRFKWKPRQLKLDILPYDELDFSRVLDALNTRGFIVKYSDSHDVYGCVLSFKYHQVINNKESPSVLPGIDSEGVFIIEPSLSNQQLTESNANTDQRVNDACESRLILDQGEGKGREGKGIGKEGKGRQLSAATRSDPQSPNPLNKKTWEAYATAFFNRHGTEPVRNAKVNSQIVQIVKNLGEEAPHVAAFYVGHNEAWYVKRMHSLDSLVKDSDALRAQWATGKMVTGKSANDSLKFGNLARALTQQINMDERF